MLVILCGIPSAASELPVLHLRKAASAPPLVATLQDPATASAWYSASPTWFGLGGKAPDRNHTEVLATYDSLALYIAFLNIDRSTVPYPRGTTTDLTTVDSNAIWIRTPEGRRFCLIAAVDNNYPVQLVQASGEFASFSPTSDHLAGWSHKGWLAGNLTIQQTVRIPWTTLSTTAPKPGARWQINLINYNQTSTSLTASTVVRQSWAPGNETQPDQWGTLAFDEAQSAPPASVTPEATLTLRPATGFGGETTLRAGNKADQPNQQTDEAITQSNWSDWDPVDYTTKEFMTFDLSMIPRDRKIISATLQNRFRGHYNDSPSDLYLHVVRLAGTYDSRTVTMLTSPLPVENGFRRLVRTSEVGSFIDFDVTDAVSKAFDKGDPKAAFALVGTSGDIHNGKIWDVSFGRSDWYDTFRPRLIITFGKPGVVYTNPVKVGSLNCTSVATTASKNKLTNGTFRYGTVEGISNTTYWQDPGWVSANGVNTQILKQAGDINPVTGNPAIRFMTPVAWMSMRQLATGLVGGTTYTYSGWYKGSSPGMKADVRIEYQDANGSALGSGYSASGDSGNWERFVVTSFAPVGTVKANVAIFNYNSGSGAYMLYSDLQLEQGSTPTAYSETMGVYYPNRPRTDGVVTTADNCINKNKLLAIGSKVTLAGRAVTAVFPGCFYIQCPEPGHQGHGIKVVSTGLPAAGSSVNINGTLATDSNDELIINASSVIPVGSCSIPAPLAVTNKAIGGGTQGNARGSDTGVGLNNVGSLSTTWGRVKSIVPGVSIVLDDGSGTPVKVAGPTGSASNGSFACVTGVASIEKSGGIHIRLIRTRSAGDVRVY